MRHCYASNIRYPHVAGGIGEVVQESVSSVKPISNSAVQGIVFSYQLEWPTLEMTMVQRLGINYQVQKRHDQVPYPILARLRQRTGDPAPPPYGVNFTHEAIFKFINNLIRGVGYYS